MDRGAWCAISTGSQRVYKTEQLTLPLSSLAQHLTYSSSVPRSTEGGLVPNLCLTLCNPMDCSPPGSSVLGISWARIWEWLAIFFSRGSFWPRNWTQISCVIGRFFTDWATRESLISVEGGLFINNLRYADDTTLMTEEELKSLLIRVKEESERAG